MSEVVVHNSGPGPPLSPNKPSVTGGARMSHRDSEVRKEKKIGHRRVTEEGTVTYKKKPTSEIQRALQLGIHHHIGSVQQKPLRDVLFRDFQTIETVQFPASGTKTTPAHSLSDFRFRTYAPIAFRNFRNRYKLDITDFLNSLCNYELRELSNPGASGSIFYITQDDEFIIKTVQHREGEFLRALLPHYFMNLMQHPCTLLPKYHGFYCYQTSSKNIRFIVMNNLLPSSVKIHEKYDLKGSTHKRRASATELAKTSPTLKDLDFRERHTDGIWLEMETYDALIKTIEQDCRVLESLQIMDYSLLLGIHNLDQAKRDRMEKNKNAQKNTVLDMEWTYAASSGDESGASSNHLSPSDGNVNGFHPDGIKTLNAVSPKARGPSADHSSHYAIPKRAEAYRAPPGADGETTNSLPVSAELGLVRDRLSDIKSSERTSSFQRGAQKARSQKRLAAYCTAMESIEASAQPVELEKEELDLIPSGGIPARSSSGDRLLLFIGIIDILQSYRLLKKLEHGFKALVIDGETVSVTPPGFYSQRFQEFLSRSVFKRIQSLDQPTLLGPNAMRFRRFVELAMKQASSKRGTMPSRKLNSIRSVDENDPYAMGEVRRRPALPPSIRRAASPAPSDPIKYNGRTSAHLLSPPNVWIITPRESTGNERIENHQSNTIPCPAWRLRHSAGGPMGSECHLSQPYTSTSCWDSDTSELNLRPSVSRFSALSPGVCGRSTGGNLKLVDAQRRARSAWNLSSNSGPGNTQHVPSHIRDALLNGLSRTESHLSMYSGTMTPSSDSEDEAHGNQPVNETSYALDSLSVVTPNAPKTILILPRSHPNLSATDYRSSSYSVQTLTKNQKYYNKSCHTYSNARSSTLLSGESSQFKDGKSTRFRGKIPSFSSLVGRQASPVPPIITVSASPCARNSTDSCRPVSNATFVENFTQDAQSSLVRMNYDPYALVQRQPPQTTTDRRARAHTSSWEDQRFGSSISSDRFSQDSAQSLPLPLGTRLHTLDRRKRCKRLQTRL